jgi:hypothetical protein
VALKRRSGSQAYFWTDRWQQMEREADADIAAGRVEVLATAEAFLASLEALDNSPQSPVKGIQSGLTNVKGLR